jgi:F0F1-type ATP synthase membrane subunit a
MSTLFGSIAWMLTCLNVSGLFEIISTTSVYTIVLVLAWLVLVSIGSVSFYHNMSRSIMLLALPSMFIVDMLAFFLIELLSLSFRTVSLSFRLCANILAGHLILHIVWGLALFVIHMSAIGSITVVGIFAFLCGLEGFMALMQVYVFTMLSTVYLLEI